jgi:cytochrome c peroxidase
MRGVSWLVAVVLVAFVAACAAQKKKAEPEAAPQAAYPPGPTEREVLTSGSWSMTLPLGLQASSAYIPDDNPMSDAKIALGKVLYFDRRFSKDRTISCASCHRPYHGFADPHATSEGVGLLLGGRNSPTVINRLFSAEQFWDGRAEDLERQAHGPLVNPVEMAMASHGDVVTRCRAVPGYGPLFAAAFGDAGIDLDRIGKAIAAYERTVLAGDSPFDRYQAGERDALSASAIRGMALFEGKANCRVCHAGFNFTDESYHNLGVGMDAAKPDLGRYEISKDERDRGAFKTPTLRNVSMTPPYMHDGSEETLLDVIELYDRGGVPNPHLSQEIKPLRLTETEKRDLVAFLEALTGPVTNATPPTGLPK